MGGGPNNSGGRGEREGVGFFILKKISRESPSSWDLRVHFYAETKGSIKRKVAYGGGGMFHGTLNCILIYSDIYETSIYNQLFPTMSMHFLR